MEEEDEETDPKKLAAGKMAHEKAVGEAVSKSDAKQGDTDEKKPGGEGTHLIKEEERATGLVRPDVIWRSARLKADKRLECYRMREGDCVWDALAGSRAFPVSGYSTRVELTVLPGIEL